MATNTHAKAGGEEDKDLNSTFDELYSGAKEKSGAWSTTSFGTYPEQPSWHDEILAICKDTGLESLATETGLIQSGEVTGVRNYNLQRGQIPSLSDPPAPAVDNTFASKSASLVSAAELVQALLTPTTPTAAAAAAAAAIANATMAASASQTSDVTPSSSRRRKRKTDSLNGTPTSPSASGRGKGLRHFSSRVCEKVEQKRLTTYNEVADELVRELQHVPFSEKGPLDQKNTRRRVYDALNVLMAMGIIAKERKEIKWLGLPNAKSPAQQEFDKLEREKIEKNTSLKRKHEMLTELHSQQSWYRNLAARNAKLEQVVPVEPSARILLPFLLVRTRQQCVINCEVDESHTEYFLNFTLPFEILDDPSVLAQLGLASALPLPPLEFYATQALNDPPQPPAPTSATATPPTPPLPAAAAAAAVAVAPPPANTQVTFAPPLPPTATAEPKLLAKK